MTSFRRWLIMTNICLSGGIIYFMPFLFETFYLPLQEALGVSKTQLGILMGTFGATSMLSYFPGGWLADRFSPRKLITISCLATGLSGFYFATFPSYKVSLALHAFWGVSITLTFWSAMIKATRECAPANLQGRVFGILEGGRGVVEAVASSIVLIVFAKLGGDRFGMMWVIILYSAMDIIVGVMAWFTLEDSIQTTSEKKEPVRLIDIIKVMKMPVVWLISIVILSAYSTYWGLDFLTPYATEVFGMTVVMGGLISVGKMWLKPIPALSAGFLADKIGASKAVAWLFLVLIGSFAIFAVLPGKPGLIPLMFVNIAVASLALFAIRGVYFAMLEEGKIPLALTGTAAGIVSIVGYTPDIFMPIYQGWTLDTYPLSRYPDAPGYKILFLFITSMCILGLWASLRIMRLSKKHQDKATDIAAEQP